ncbi:hypothetical protein L1987_38834 [Smallanthus sonchifolius]|uniref:Uncharacterized protein n=1 Tax=Smallanthus sonchifolius TaxID=185202 RepID=A0ACB9HK34_9ASTR|nr:hypothetical protein L1987_38834 [Smallanthus sonchifolius]
MWHDMHDPWMVKIMHHGFRRVEKGEKEVIYVGKFVEALDFVSCVNSVLSLLFHSAEFAFLFAVSFDAFEAKKDLFWIRVFWLFSNTVVLFE